MSAPENPPAFPACNEANVNETMGMTLRDYFAGQALPRAIDAVATGKASLADWTGTAPQTAASIAYAMADAMLEARTKGGAA